MHLNDGKAPDAYLRYIGNKSIFVGMSLVAIR